MTCIQRKIKKNDIQLEMDVLLCIGHFVLATKIAKNHGETLTPSTDYSQYSFVLEKDFEQYF
jgi:hypothetical protein